MPNLTGSAIPALQLVILVQLLLELYALNEIRSKEDSVLWDVFAASGPAELGGREDNIGNKNKRFNDLKYLHFIFTSWCHNC